MPPKLMASFSMANNVMWVSQASELSNAMEASDPVSGATELSVGDIARLCLWVARNMPLSSEVIRCVRKGLNCGRIERFPFIAFRNDGDGGDKGRPYAVFR